MTSPVIFGTQPQLIGKSLDGLMVEYMHVVNEADRSLTVVFLEAEGKWTRLALDAGTIHWRPQNEVPTSWALADEGFTYKVEDVATSLGLTGSTVLDLKVLANGSVARVELQLSDQRSVILMNKDDETKISVCQA